MFQTQPCWLCVYTTPEHNLQANIYMHEIYMVKWGIAQIYDPKPRSEEVCSSITLEPEGRGRYGCMCYIKNRLMKRS